MISFSMECISATDEMPPKVCNRNSRRFITYVHIAASYLDTKREAMSASLCAPPTPSCTAAQPSVSTARPTRRALPHKAAPSRVGAAANSVTALQRPGYHPLGVQLHPLDWTVAELGYPTLQGCLPPQAVSSGRAVGSAIMRFGESSQ